MGYGANKYNAKKTVVDNITFHSAKEAARYNQLKLLNKAGQIYQLTLQPEFKLYSYKGVLIGKYIADFAYFETNGGGRVVEDVKGVRTPLYRRSKKHVEADYGIKVREVQRV